MLTTYRNLPVAAQRAIYWPVLSLLATALCWSLAGRLVTADSTLLVWAGFGVYTILGACWLQSVLVVLQYLASSTGGFSDA